MKLIVYLVRSSASRVCQSLRFDSDQRVIEYQERSQKMFQNIRMSGMGSVCGPFIEGSYSTTRASAADDVSCRPYVPGVLDNQKKSVPFVLQPRILPFLSLGGAEAAGAGVGIL